MFYNFLTLHRNTIQILENNKCYQAFLLFYFFYGRGLMFLFFWGGGGIFWPPALVFHTKYLPKMSKIVLDLNWWSVTRQCSTAYIKSPIWKQLMCHVVLICIALVSHIYLKQLSDWSIKNIVQVPKMFVSGVDITKWKNENFCLIYSTGFEAQCT